LSFLSLRGASSSSPHDPLVEDSHLLISCTTITDTVVLFDFAAGQTPYQAYNTDYDASEGRSLTGVLRKKGGQYAAKKRLELAFLVNDVMILTIEAMLEAQQDGEVVQVVDHWNTSPITKNMWLDVADRYRTQITKNRHLLQLSALEI